VLVSDGGDNCKPPDPCAVAREISKGGIDLKIQAVGFQVKAGARRQLKCIAKAGGGRYVDATDAEGLSGIHFVSVAAREGGSADAPEQFDTRIEFEVAGAATTPTPSASARATASAPPQSGGDGSGLPVGAIVLGLAVGLVAGFGGRVALSRR
jgi:hypothetical protein